MKKLPAALLCLLLLSLCALGTRCAALRRRRQGDC